MKKLLLILLLCIPAAAQTWDTPSVTVGVLKLSSGDGWYLIVTSKQDGSDTALLNACFDLQTVVAGKPQTTEACDVSIIKLEKGVALASRQYKVPPDTLRSVEVQMFRLVDTVAVLERPKVEKPAADPKPADAETEKAQ